MFKINLQKKYFYDIQKYNEAVDYNTKVRK